MLVGYLILYRILTTNFHHSVSQLPITVFILEEFSEFRERIEKSAAGLVHNLVGDGLGLFSRLSHLGQSDREGYYDPLSQARDLLESRLEQRLSIGRILEPVPLSYAHLREKFKESMGVSPGQYRIRGRIEKACFYLTAEHLTPGETAQKLGYEDTSSFSKQFKKIMTLTPGEYCQLHKKN